jgi:hypothetical protein
MKNLLILHHVLKRNLTPALIFFLLLEFPIMPCNSTPKGKKPNFSGTWVLNESKSEFGEYGHYWAPSKLIIAQKRKKLAIERFAPGPSGKEMDFKGNYTMDGKECENVIFEQSKSKSTVNWSEDNKNLTINSTMNVQVQGQDMEIKSVEIYSLEKDAKSLVIKSTSSTPYGDFSVTFVFDME